jgi:hypothetical protein
MTLADECYSVFTEDCKQTKDSDEQIRDKRLEKRLNAQQLR